MNSMSKLPPKTGLPTAIVLPRVAGRISFCYVDRARVVRNEFGVAVRVYSEEHGREEIELPVARLASLLLGPGTSITQPALSLATKSGCAVVCVGSGAAGATAVALPSGQSSEWLEKQVRLWADKDKRLEVARRLYKMRFAMDPGEVSLATLRGLEGARVKQEYRRLSKKHGISFRRAYRPEKWDDADPVNRALSTANHILYGVVQSAMAALGVHPALGFIHTGTDRAFVFDVADLYKLKYSAPAAFACHDSDDPEAGVRRIMRKKVRMFRLLGEIVPDIQHVLDPTAKRSVSQGDPFLLWDPDVGAVPSGTNYEGEPW